MPRTPAEVYSAVEHAAQYGESFIVELDEVQAAEQLVNQGLLVRVGNCEYELAEEVPI